MGGVPGRVVVWATVLLPSALIMGCSGSRQPTPPTISIRRVDAAGPQVCSDPSAVPNSLAPLVGTKRAGCWLLGETVLRSADIASAQVMSDASQPLCQPCVQLRLTPTAARQLLSYIEAYGRASRASAPPTTDCVPDASGLCVNAADSITIPGGTPLQLVAAFGRKAYEFRPLPDGALVLVGVDQTTAEAIVRSMR